MSMNGTAKEEVSVGIELTPSCWKGGLPSSDRVIRYQRSLIFCWKERLALRQMRLRVGGWIFTVFGRLELEAETVMV